MKNRIRFAITLAGVVMCALPNLAMAQSGLGDPTAIEGTWIMTITPMGAPAGFTALVWFSAGGTTGATGTDDRLPPFALVPTEPISTLIGSWTRTDNNTYVSSINFFSFDPVLGTAVYMIQNNITYSLTDYNHLKGHGNSVKCDISETPHCSLYNPSIKVTGTRLIAQGASN
jgi:hypothetical protein